MSDANALKDQGNKAFAAKKYEEAIDLFTQAIALDPKNHVLYSNRSAARAGLKQWDVALVDAEECIRVNPSWSKGYARKGAALHGLRRWDEAVTIYEEGIRLEGDSPSAALTKGLKEVKDAKRADEADTGIGKIFQDPNMFGKLAANPRTAPLLADQAFVNQLRLLQTNPQLAATAFNDPRLIQVMGVLMGIDMQAFTRPEGSNETPTGFEPSSPIPPTPFSPTSRPSPSPAPASHDPHRPSTTTAPNTADTAMAEPEEEDEEAKDKAEALKEKRLGNDAYKKRDFENAEKHFAAAWDKWPKDITFLTNLAAVHFENGDFPKTIEVCDKAIEEGRSIRADYKLIAKAYGRIGSSYSKMGDLENAIKFYQKSLTEHRTPDILGKLHEAEKIKKERDLQTYINPELSAAAREEGNKLFKAGDFAGSVKSYTEGIKRDPKDPRGYNNRAAAYTKLAALPEALKDAEKAVEVDSTFVKGYIRKATVLYGMREYTKAMEACHRATDADTEHKHTREIEQELQKISMAIYTQREDESEEETLQRAMRDPEVAGIMQDPVMQQILQQAQQDPKALQDHMKNPIVREKIQKLVAAGIIRTR